MPVTACTISCQLSQTILDAWEENRDAETHGLEARKSLAIVLALYESARRDGAPVDVT